MTSQPDASLPYERLLGKRLLFAIKLLTPERLLVLQASGWHLDGVCLANTTEFVSRDRVCADYGLRIVMEFGQYLAIVASTRSRRRMEER